MRCPERATATVSLYFGMNVLGDLFDLFGDCEADEEAFAGPTGGPARIIQGLGQSLGNGVYLPPVVETLNGAAEVLVALGEQTRASPQQRPTASGLSRCFSCKRPLSLPLPDRIGGQPRMGACLAGRGFHRREGGIVTEPARRGSSLQPGCGARVCPRSPRDLHTGTAGRSGRRGDHGA